MYVTDADSLLRPILVVAQNMCQVFKHQADVNKKGRKKIGREHGRNSQGE